VPECPAYEPSPNLIRTNPILLGLTPFERLAKNLYRRVRTSSLDYCNSVLSTVVVRFHRYHRRHSTDQWPRLSLPLVTEYIRSASTRSVMLDFYLSSLRRVRSKYCHERICMCVCLLACLSRKLHGRSSPNLGSVFLRMTYFQGSDPMASHAYAYTLTTVLHVAWGHYRTLIGSDFLQGVCCYMTTGSARNRVLVFVDFGSISQRQRACNDPHDQQSVSQI